MQNLITNALAFHDSYKPEPYVLEKTHITECNAIIEILDNGIGINPEHHHRIFEIFFRGSQLTLGSGLGLYISKEILSEFRGSIHVESETGKSSRFIVSVPNQYSIETENSLVKIIWRNKLLTPPEYFDLNAGPSLYSLFQVQ